MRRTTRWCSPERMLVIEAHADGTDTTTHVNSMPTGVDEPLDAARPPRPTTRADWVLMQADLRRHDTQGT